MTKLLFSSNAFMLVCLHCRWLLLSSQCEPHLWELELRRPIGCAIYGKLDAPEREKMLWTPLGFSSWWRSQLDTAIVRLYWNSIYTYIEYALHSRNWSVYLLIGLQYNCYKAVFLVARFAYNLIRFEHCACALLTCGELYLQWPYLMFQVE